MTIPKIRVSEFVLACLLSFTQTAQADSDKDMTAYSFMWQAFAANAGGQAAYAIKRARGEREYGLFLNEYLLSNGKPVFGATYDFRYALCGPACPLQFYANAGVGLSSGGPLIELGWSSYWLWLLRIDVTTQLFFEKQHMVHWSYPLWLGISIPLP